LPPKILLNSKVAKIDQIIIISLRKSKTMTHSVRLPFILCLLIDAVIRPNLIKLLGAYLGA
jgi:hypothetical protein